MPWIGHSTSTVILANFPTTKTWVIEDALTFDDSGGAPVNTFDSDGSRSLRPNPMCWLATVVPDGAGAARAGTQQL